MKNKKIVILSTIIVILFAIIFFSDHGWLFPNKTCFVPTDKSKELVENLKMHVYKLSHDIGNRNVADYDKLKETERYIFDSFKVSGYSPELQSYNVSGKTVNNIVVTKKGIGIPEEYIIIGAHYDSCYNPGADDNASGVAGLIEIAKLSRNIDTNHTIKFVAFVNEEPPYFKTLKMGSMVYVSEAKSKGEAIEGAIILEMLGCYSDKLNSQGYPKILGMFYPNKANFVLMVGNDNSHPLLTKVMDNFKQATDFPIEKTELSFISGSDFSDHWSFWQVGYPAIMVTDTAFLRNNNYHTNEDTYEKLNYESMGEVVRGLSEVLRKF